MLRLLSRLLGPTSRPTPTLPPRPLAEQMEPRLLYSADLMPVDSDAAAGMPAAEIRSLNIDTGAWLGPSATQRGGAELLFVDAGVANADALTAELSAERPGLEVIRLDDNKDGIEQIGEALAGRSDVAAVHLISHGAAGVLQLGSDTLNQAGLEAREENLTGWRQALAADADILLYGCDLASDTDGLAFIATLARLTGADVAASSDRTGSLSGANWVLEAHSGEIETSTLSSRNWQGSLALTAVSGDIKVNSVSSFEQAAPKVAMLDNGNWMSVWAADNVILVGQMIGARTFNAAGTGLSPDLAVDMSGTSITPDISTDGTSRFVVTWVSSQNGNQDIYARLFNASGSPLGAAFMVTNGDAAASAGDQQDPNVAMNASGDFVVTWSGKGSDDSDGIYARRFDGSGTALGSVFTVNADTTGKQVSPDVAINDEGRFVITWVDEGQGKAVLVRTFDASGAAGGVITVEPDVADPAVAMDSSGAFSLVWAENGVDSDKHAIVLQSFDADGTPVGARIQVNTTEADQQERPAIAMTSQGDMVITWESNKQDGDDVTTVLRTFTAGAAVAGDEIIANTYTVGAQETPDIALNDAGQLVVVWSGERASGSGSDLGGKTFSWPEAIVPVANTAPVLDNSSAVVLGTIDEDAPAPVGATGWLISEIVSFAGSGSGPQNVKDADAGALTGIALVAANADSGRWHFSVDGGTSWTLLDASMLSSGNALLLAANGQTRLHYTPDANTNGTLTPALRFRAWEHFSGSNGSFADTTVNGGVTAFSTAIGTASLTVRSINDLPTITTNRLVIQEGGTVTLDSSMLSASDVETPAANLLYSVATSSDGFFATSTSPTTPIGSFTQADVNAGRIIFTHDGSEAAPAYRLTVTDSDDGTSPPSDALIIYTPVNDAPSVDGPGADINVLRGNGPPVGAVGANVASLVSLSGSGSGAQNISDPDTGALAGMAVVMADTTNGIWHYSTDGGVTWSPLGAVSSASARLLAADGNTRLYFEHTSATTGSFGNALEFRAWDRSSGANGSLADPSGGGGSSAFSSNSGYLQLNVIDVNLAPVLVPVGPIAISVLEGAPAPVNGSADGLPISSLVSPIGSGNGPRNVSDANGDLVGIALYDATRTNGTWWYSINGGNSWTTIGALGPTGALLLANDGLTRLYYQPTAADTASSDLDTLGFRAWDGSTGVNGGIADVTANGANTAFSTGVETASLSIVPVNDLPVVVQGTPLAVTEGQISVVSAANLSASDVETPASGLIYSIRTVSGGIFALASAPGTAIAGFTQADIDAGIVRFEHDGSETIPAYIFSLSDGTATTGPFTGSLSFTRVNDAPAFVATDSPIYSLDEDAGTPFGATGIPVQEMVSLVGSGSGPQNVSDPDAAGLSGIAIVDADTSNGRWYYTLDFGLSWTPLAAASPTNATLLAASNGVRLAFRPGADYNGTTPGALSFVAWDRTVGSSGGTANTTVGSAFSVDSHALTLTVRPVNDPPFATPVTLGSIAEDTPLTITQSMLTAGSGDIDGDALAAINLLLTSGDGTLVDNADGSWTFTPAANWNGSAGFAYELDDGTATITNNAMLIVAAVNDPPSITTNTLVISEGQRVVLDRSMISASDAESTATALTYSVSGLGGGSFALADAPTVPISTFTQAQIDSGSVVFTHDGSEAAPTYTLTVSDGTGAASPASTATIAFTNTNDPPSVGPIDLGSILEDGSRRITQADLLAGATDADADALVARDLTLLGGTGSLIDNGDTTWTFAPSANWNGNAHFGFTVSDGSLAVANTASLIVTPLNDPPEVSGIDLGSILEDGSRHITQTDLLAGATDADADTLVARNLTLLGGTGSLIDNGDGTWTFTPAANWNGSVRFGFSVSDGTAMIDGAALLNVEPVNDAPFILSNRLTVIEGQTVTLDTTGLDGRDIDNADASLDYSVISVTGGYFALADAPGTPIVRFSQTALAAGTVRFVHDASEMAPSFTLTLSDGELDSAPSAAVLAFTPVNDAPSIDAPGTQVIPAGSGFGPLDLHLGDEESAPADLVVRAYSTNQAVLPDSAIRLSGSGAIRSLSVTGGYGGMPGVARIVIEVSDGDKTTTASLDVYASSVSAVPTPVNASTAEPPQEEVSSPPPAEPEAEIAVTAAPSAPDHASGNRDTLAEALLIGEPTAPIQSLPERTGDDVAVIAIDRVVVAPIRLGTPEILGLLYAPAEAAEPAITDGPGSREQRETRLEQAFSELRNSAEGEARGERQEVAVAIATGTGLTIGYVAWLIRGGVLVSSLLTSMPAWRLLDPLPILGNIRADDSDDDDSLESMVDSAGSQTPAPATTSPTSPDATDNASPEGGR